MTAPSARPVQPDARGANAGTAPAETSGRRVGAGRAVAVAAVAAAAVAAVFGILFGLKGAGGTRNNYLYSENSLLVTYEGYGGESYSYSHVIDDRGVRQMDGSVERYAVSGDGKAGFLCVLDDTVDEYRADLYYYALGEEPEPVRKDVGYVTISYDGSALLYTSGSYDDSMQQLYVWTPAKGEELLDEGAYFNSLEISPDGDTVVYAVADAAGMTNRYIWDGKSSEAHNELPDGIVAISNGAKQIWHYGSGSYNDACVYTKNGDQRLGSGMMFSCFNCDNTEAVFSNEDGTYVSVGGDEPVKLYSGYCDLLKPYGLQILGPTERGDGFISCGIRHFAGSYMTFYGNDDTRSVLYVDKDLQTRIVVSGISDCGLASDGKTIVYLKDGMICRMNGMKTKRNTAEQLAYGAGAFQMSADGKRVYYIKEGTSELWAAADDAGAECSLRDVISMEDGWYSSGYPFQYMADGQELYAATADGLYHFGSSTPDSSYAQPFENTFLRWGHIQYIWCSGPLVSVGMEDDNGDFFCHVIRDGESLLEYE